MKGFGPECPPAPRWRHRLRQVSSGRRCVPVQGGDAEDTEHQARPPRGSSVRLLSDSSNAHKVRPHSSDSHI